METLAPKPNLVGIGVTGMFLTPESLCLTEKGIPSASSLAIAFLALEISNVILAM